MERPFVIMLVFISVVILILVIYGKNKKSKKYLNSKYSAIVCPLRVKPPLSLTMVKPLEQKRRVYLIAR